MVRFCSNYAFKSRLKSEDIINVDRDNNIRNNSKKRTGQYYWHNFKDRNLKISVNFNESQKEKLSQSTPIIHGPRFIALLEFP